MDSSREYRRIGVYSRNSAPGIIVAHGEYFKAKQVLLVSNTMPIQHCVYMYNCTHTGNTGSYLTDTGTVYITRDGGLSWEQVDKRHNCYKCIYLLSTETVS